MEGTQNEPSFIGDPGRAKNRAPFTRLCRCAIYPPQLQPNRLIGNFIPQCETDGTYKKIQRNGSTGYSFCVNPMTGEKKGEAKRGMMNC
ncbi:hypothetical protein TNCV_3018951 [Trichonephila clavipes]|nr:hypothetical protein TNCV_3018951 [Trichonephila clavipes]